MKILCTVVQEGLRISNFNLKPDEMQFASYQTTQTWLAEKFLFNGLVLHPVSYIQN